MGGSDALRALLGFKLRDNICISVIYLTIYQELYGKTRKVAGTGLDEAQSVLAHSGAET